MGRKKKEEQLDLIDVSPANSKAIIKQARLYNNTKSERIKALAREVEYKGNLLALIKEANLKRLEDGVIRFHLDGMTINVKPRDELVTVEEDA